MNCHERTTAALNLQQPDRVPVFSCTEEQNQIYEILGEQGSAVPLSLIQQGITGAAFKLAAPLINASGWFNRELEKFMNKKVCSWLMYSAIFKIRDNRQATDIYGRLYDFVADGDGNLDTPMYREGLLTTPEKWNAWPHPDPDKLYKSMRRVYADLQRSYGDRIYLMGSLCWGIWENASQTMGLPGFAVALRRDPDFVRRMVKYYETLYLAAVHAAADAHGIQERPPDLAARDGRVLRSQHAPHRRYGPRARAKDHHSLLRQHLSVARLVRGLGL